ncbi:MAG: VWA domain-containing protein [Beijerinckiaceae bacterium]|nr:VWA domain-containing protein [Beijerinckiaceae bacterium]
MSIFQRFLKNSRGSMGVSLGLGLVPIVAVMGLAVDYSNSVSAKYRLQQVLDSTATAIATDTDASLIPPAALQARAQTYAQSLSGGLDVEGLTLTVTLTADEVSVVGSAQTKLTFGQIFGQNSREVRVAVTVLRGKMKNIELAMVLDNTGSMAGQKITQLRAAVKGLVDFFEPRVEKQGDVKIAMVPFTNAVRVERSWMPNWMLRTNPPNNWSGCVQDRSAPYDITDQAPSSGVGDSLYWWTGGCGQLAEIIPMTDNLGKIRDAADTMIASGTTNVPLGMAWGWHALSSGLPLTEGSPPEAENKVRVMIVLTDGENTQHRWAGGSNGIDDRMRLICTNVKNTGITVFTVRVINGDANLLRDCATSPNHYFNVTNANQLKPVFEQIASAMSKMRIAK